MHQSESDFQLQAKFFKMENQNLEQRINARVNKLEKKFIETQEELKNNSKKLEQLISLLSAEKS